MKKKKKTSSDFHEKVIKGLELTYKRLLQSKIEKNQSWVIMTDVKVVTVKASELITQ